MSFKIAKEHLRNYQRQVRELAREKRELETTRFKLEQIERQQAERELALQSLAKELEKKQREQEKTAQQQYEVEVQQRETERRQSETAAKQFRIAGIQKKSRRLCFRAMSAELPPLFPATPNICVDEVSESDQVSSATLIDSSVAEDTLTPAADAPVAVAPTVAAPAAAAEVDNTNTGSLPGALITLKEGYKKAIAVCHLLGSKLNVFGKTARSVDSFYPGEAISQSPICLRELTEEETVAWDAVMALCNSLDSTTISRLSHDKAAIFKHVESEVLNDIDHCVRFLMGQSDKQFKSALQWFRVPPPPADLQRLTAQGFEMYATEASKRGQVLPPNLVATFLKRLLRKVHAGVITPSMQAAIAKMQPSEANVATIAQLLRLNGGRHHIVLDMARLASRILQVDAALSVELAVVMPLTNVGVSDAYAELMAKKAMQVQACGDAERDARDAAVMKEMTEGLTKWNEVVGWMYLHPELLV
ncbi:hypothetical protein BJ741DRAFT_186744 [Chytriomyces cf. hyalinus JEL632]|nr:hypothetical protein BJ741DRAFT_186744 [Chytriomyces cf. hyalinus JEL632]